VHLVADVEMADTKKRVQVSGESNIPKTAGKIKRVWLEPGNAPAFPPAIAAILSADLIIVGPGSLYTSLLPNLLVSDLAEAIRASRAIKFYVCNVATQPGETDGYSSTDHLYTLEKHVTGRLFDLIICNRRYDGLLPQGIGWVKTDPNLEENYAVYQADLIDEENPWRHDSTKLAQVINDLFYERTGPLAD